MNDICIIIIYFFTLLGSKLRIEELEVINEVEIVQIQTIPNSSHHRKYPVYQDIFWGLEKTI